MSTTTISADPARRGNRTLLLIIALGVQIALLGVYVGARTVFAGGPAVLAPATGGPFGIASDVRTSFGSIVVGTAQTLKGVSARNLGGMSHGINGYVPPDKAQVQVTVEITNRLRVPVAYAPDQFTLRSGGATIRPTTASIRPATLLPDAAVEATLIYVVPRTGQALRLAFKDPKRSTPFLVNLGRVDTAPPGTDDHSHR